MRRVFPEEHVQGFLETYSYVKLPGFSENLLWWSLFYKNLKAIINLLKKALLKVTLKMNFNQIKHCFRGCLQILLRLYPPEIIRKSISFKWLERYSNPQTFTSLAKWLSVHLQTKGLWVRVPLQSLKPQIWRLFRARSSFTFRQL